MTRVCSWCGREIGPDGHPGALASEHRQWPEVKHGICVPCQAEHFGKPLLEIEAHEEEVNG